MESPELLQHLTALFGEKVANEAVCPYHLGVIARPHAIGTHQAANGEWVTFRLTIEEGRVGTCFFTAHGNAVLFAAASILSRLVEGLQLRHALAHMDSQTVAQELGAVSEGDEFLIVLACEALRKALTESIKYIREPWKTLYNTNR